MKANELRIGNLYYEGVNILKVRSITSYEGMPSFLNHIQVEDGDITPIQLTEEWLIKFGFKCNYKDILDQTFYEIKINDDFKMYYSIIKKTASLDKKYVGNVYTKKIEYVHQLQNLYFALTGEELTIG